MSDQLTDAELAEIEERVNAATAGPWFAPDIGFDVRTETDKHGYSNVIVFGGGDDDDDYNIDTPETREFIAHSRQDVPRLLAEVRRLRAHVERVTASHRTEGE